MKYAKTKSKTRVKRSQQEDLKKIADLWLEWHVAKDTDGSLSSFGFEIKSKPIDSADYYQVSVPVLALYHLAEKYNWLQVLRGPRHRPDDPYELLSFIQMLNSLNRIGGDN